MLQWRRYPSFAEEGEMWACPHEEIQMKSKRQCYVCVYEL